MLRRTGTGAVGGGARVLRTEGRAPSGSGFAPPGTRTRTRATTGASLAAVMPGASVRQLKPGTEQRGRAYKLPTRGPAAEPGGSGARRQSSGLAAKQIERGSGWRETEPTAGPGRSGAAREPLRSRSSPRRVAARTRRKPPAAWTATRSRGACAQLGAERTAKSAAPMHQLHWMGHNRREGCARSKWRFRWLLPCRVIVGANAHGKKS